MITAKELLMMQDKVLEWNEVFGNDVANKSLVKVYQGLVHEEFMDKDEFYDSYRRGDAEGIMDGLCDLVFVFFFYAALHERDFQPHDSWLGSVSDEYVPINGHELKELVERMKMFLTQDVLDSFAFQTEFVLLLKYYSLYYDLIGAFARVAESNMSKSIPVSEKDKVEEYLKEIEDAGRYGDLFTEESNGHIIFKARKCLRSGKEFPSGKIVKGSFYKSVEDLGGLWEFVNY